jgi:hypothetical protein
MSKPFPSVEQRGCNLQGLATTIKQMFRKMKDCVFSLIPDGLLREAARFYKGDQNCAHPQAQE